MKKVLSIVLAMIMVMALSITVFADIDLTGEATYPANATIIIPIPEGVDATNGQTITISAKGTSENTAVRIYLSNSGDANGRTTEIAVLEVVDGAFEGTFDFVIDSTGGIEGTVDPTSIIVKGPDYATPLANTTLEVLSIVGADAAPADETPAADEAPAADAAPADEAPVADEAPAADDAPANTGIVLAVLPMAIAAAAVVATKRK